MNDKDHLIQQANELLQSADALEEDHEHFLASIEEPVAVLREVARLPKKQPSARAKKRSSSKS